MKVYEAVANAFVKEGTSCLFGLLGDSQLDWWSSLSQHSGVKIVDVREEGAGLAMAEGWAHVSGEVGVCSVTQGPGLARLALGLIAATRSHAPVVVYTSKTAFHDERTAQFLNQDRFVTASEAGYLEVLTPSFAETAVRQAFYRARLESRPIVLCVPKEVRGKEIDSEGDDYQPSRQLFRTRQSVHPDPVPLNEAAEIIARSTKPVIISGRGAMAPAARAAIERLGQRIGALLATSLVAKGTLSGSEYHTGISGFFSTRTVMRLYEEADCVIAVGASLNTRTIGGGLLYPKARYIHIDQAPHRVMGNEQGADCYIQGDAAASVQALDELLAQQGVSNDGYRTPAVRKALQEDPGDPGEFEIEPGTVDPRQAVRLIDDRLPLDVGLVTGTAHNFNVSCCNMSKPRPLQLYVNSFTGVGQVIGNAIGAAIASNGPIVALDGDGSAMQNIQELDTASRVGVKLLYVVLNDEAYGVEYHRLKEHGLNADLSAVRSPDLGAVGTAFGCRGRLARSLDEVAAGVDEFMAGEGPMVLDVRISRNVLSVAHRRLQGEDV